MKIDRFIEHRFWKYVDKKEPEKCWKWTGALLKYGYGVLRIDKRSERAHRLSWEIHYGPIPEGALVLHKCDNRSCVNPHHLYLGTHSDNSRDYLKRGGRSTIKLNPKAVREIRELAKTGTSIEMLAVEYGVSKCQMWKVVNKRSWRWIE